MIVGSFFCVSRGGLLWTSLHICSLNIASTINCLRKILFNGYWLDRIGQIILVGGSASRVMVPHQASEHYVCVELDRMLRHFSWNFTSRLCHGITILVYFSLWKSAVYLMQHPCDVPDINNNESDKWNQDIDTISFLRVGIHDWWSLQCQETRNECMNTACIGKGQKEITDICYMLITGLATQNA